jgi:hypothetical protein
MVWLAECDACLGRVQSPRTCLLGVTCGRLWRILSLMPRLQHSTLTYTIDRTQRWAQTLLGTLLTPCMTLCLLGLCVDCGWRGRQREGESIPVGHVLLFGP